MTTTNTKITRKDYFNTLIAVLQDVDWADKDVTYDISLDDMIQFCEKEISKIEQKNEKAKTRRSEAKKNPEDDVLTKEILNLLGFVPITINEILSKLDYVVDDITPAKISYRCSQLVKNGQAVRSTVSPDGSKRKLVAFSLPAEGSF